MRRLNDKMNAMTKILPLLFSALLATSCTIVDFGGALDEVGKQEAVPQQVKRTGTYPQLLGDYKPAPTPAWQNGDTYYIQLPVAYVPAQDWWISHMSPHTGFDYPDNLTDEQISRYPTEIYYAVLTREQFREACSHPKIEFKRGGRLRNMQYDIIPASQVDLKGATYLTDCASDMPQRILQDRLPYRRSTGNQLRRPLVFLLDVADIPLSIVATPIGWAADVILRPFVR